MTVTIPIIQQHNGYAGNLITAEISDKCPVCGGPRGEAYNGFSYDGSQRLTVTCWKNPCGHIDLYQDVVKEIARAAMERNNSEPEGIHRY
jgi:hypothetical protein